MGGAGAGGTDSGVKNGGNTKTPERGEMGNHGGAARDGDGSWNGRTRWPRIVFVVVVAIVAAAGRPFKHDRKAFAEHVLHSSRRCDQLSE